MTHHKKLQKKPQHTSMVFLIQLCWMCSRTSVWTDRHKGTLHSRGMLERNATGRNHKSTDLRNPKFREVSILRIWCTLLLTVWRYHQVPMLLSHVLSCYGVTRHHPQSILQKWHSKGFTTAGGTSVVGFRMNESPGPSGIYSGRKHLLSPGERYWKETHSVEQSELQDHAENRCLT